MLSAAWRHGAPLELWGGVECSVVRIGDTWRDQVRETGHHERGEADIDRIADLGVRTVRYPLSWERASDAPSPSEGWRWHERQLAKLEECGVGVVAGFVHHGSGPQGTDFLDPLFPEKLAAYASHAASAFSSVAAWTPLNEPLTTARFACLYGHWHPHQRDEGLFLQAVVAQCRAILLAMRAIRKVRPDARFLHTEDLGRVFSTAPVREQAAYENERRWLSLDLLCGRVGLDHPWRRQMEVGGVRPRHLDELATGEATPDLIGINHYVTSDRFLDHRTRLYRKNQCSGNGRQVYADTEAVRVGLEPGQTGWEPRLREVWQRYRRPMVVSEAHLGCVDPNEQIRWLAEAWEAAVTLRREGADLRAVTAWALFGLVDWDSLLRRKQGHYEAGAFDARFEPPAPTLLAEAISAFAKTGSFHHPALQEPGWWRREEEDVVTSQHAPV